jgi:hypothetical protein
MNPASSSVSSIIVPICYGRSFSNYRSTPAWSHAAVRKNRTKFADGAMECRESHHEDTKDSFLPSFQYRSTGALEGYTKEHKEIKTHFGVMRLSVLPLAGRRGPFDTFVLHDSQFASKQECLTRIPVLLPASS